MIYRAILCTVQYLKNGECMMYLIPMMYEVPGTRSSVRVGAIVVEDTCG